MINIQNIKENRFTGVKIFSFYLSVCSFISSIVFYGIFKSVLVLQVLMVGFRLELSLCEIESFQAAPSKVLLKWQIMAPLLFEYKWFILK